MRALIMAALVVLIATATVAAPPTATASPEEPGWGSEPPAEISRPAFGDRSSPIRPGANMNGYCTYNFVFYERIPAPQVPRVYIGTAAHCTERLGERTRLGAAGTVIGTVVYDADLVGSGVDFSLIRIDADLVGKTNPTVLGVGGPAGVTAVNELALADRVSFHGHGLVLGAQAQTRTRTGVLVGWTNREYVADMPAVDGDSGAPVVHDRTGKALGVVSRYGVFATPPSTDTGPLVTWVQRELAAAGFDNLVLATAQ